MHRYFFDTFICRGMESNSRRLLFSIGVSLASLAGILLLASVSSSDTSDLQQSDSYSSIVRSQLDAAAAPPSTTPTPSVEPSATSDTEGADQFLPPALKGFVPHVDKIKLPTSWSAIRKTFGAHLDWAFILAFLAFLTWAYVRYVRPKLPKTEGENMVLDENDVTASLHLGPGEELYFIDCETGQEGNVGIVQMFGGSNRVSKLAVTSRRVVAQFREATFCGTCQVGDFFFRDLIL